MPDSIIVDAFIKMIFNIEKYPNHWGRLSQKSLLIFGLELVANTIENDIYKKMKTTDQLTNIWFKKETLYIATSIREYKKWVLTPKSDTQELIKKQLAQNFVYIITGNWDSLARIAPSDIPRPQKILLFLSFLKVILLAMFPFLLFWITQLSPLALKKPVSEYVVIGTILWAILTVVSAFDPTFSTKINAIKDISEIFPFIGKKP